MIENRHLMSRNELAEMQHAETKYLLTIKHCLQDCPQWRNSRKKFNIQGDIGTLLGKNYEVKKMMMFLKKTEMYEEI